MINKALRLLRVINDMKLKDLAVILKVSQSYLSEIEKGTKTASLKLIDKYAEIFDIPSSSILYLSENLDKDSSLKSKISKAVINFLIELN